MKVRYAGNSTLNATFLYKYPNKNNQPDERRMLYLKLVEMLLLKALTMA